MEEPESNDRAHIGRLGEDIACRYLENKGFSVVGRNYRKKWGEIDVIAQKSGKLYFVEVKSVSRPLDDGNTAVGGYRPEENVHPQKLKRLARTIQSYLLEKRLGGREWQFDVVTVLVDTAQKKAKVERLENIVL